MINKISETTKQNTIRKSVKNVPTQPSAVGITEQQLKDRFVGVVTDPTNSAYAEIDRVVDEANAELQARDNAFNEHINNAEIHKPNVIEKILVNGIEKQPNVEKAVNITAEDLGAGKPNGLAQLDANQKLLTDQLPDGINTYEYYDSFDDFPETGESGVTYVDTTENHIYLWTGADYTSITAQLALGETSNTAYRGDRGKIAYDHSQSTGNPHQTAFDEILDKPTTLAGYGITDALKKGDQSKVVNDAFLTRITATNDVEIIDSPLGVKTATIKSIKGLSIKAIQKSGDFRTGALNDWSANAGYALSIGNNILTVTVNTDTPGQVVLTNNVQAQPDRAHFIMCYVKTIAATSVQVGFSDGVKSVAKTTTANQWTYVSSKLSTNALSSPQIIVDCSSMTKGDSFQVCLFEVIDLEDSGIQDWTNEKLDATIPLLEYFEDVRHSNPIQLKSIGDNLLVFDNYNKTETVNGMTLTTYPDGRIKLNGTATATANIYLFGNNVVSSALNAQAISYLKGQRVKYVPNVISGTYYNGSISFICHTSWRHAANTVAFSIPITSAGTSDFYKVLPGDITGFRIYFKSGATADNLVLQPMLLHADNPLIGYKLYTEHILELPQYTLRRLPDGTEDEITPTHYIQRINPETMTALEEPIYTPIEWDNTYPVWNYGLEQLYDTDGNHEIAELDIEYELDVAKQVSTNVEIVQRNENRLASSEIAIGVEAYANGDFSTALGRSAEATGSRSTALGYTAAANGTYSTALGANTQATKERSTALGYDTQANGAYSTALGSSAEATGNYSTALGYYAQANGADSTALGSTAEATGNYSTALGYDTQANGAYSTALGSTAEATGNYSTALGCNTRANGADSTALGFGAQVSESESSTMRLGSNSLSSLKCAVALTVSSDERDKADITDIPDDKALEFVKSLNPIQYVRNPRTEYEYEQSSEKKRKYGLGDYDKEAHARGDKKGTRKRVGFSAQQIEQLIKDIFDTDNYADIVYDNFYDLTEKPQDAESQKTVAYEKLIPFLVAAIKEQQKQIDELRQSIELNH